MCALPTINVGWALPTIRRAKLNPLFWWAVPTLRRHHARRGLTLVEVVASTMIVGLMAVAALNSLGAATRSSEWIGNRAVAQGLADELLAEILQTAYAEPSGSLAFGPDGAESVGPRSAFDDVDDYNGWNTSPPQYRDGTAMPDRAEWRQRVEVDRVEPTDPTQSTASDEGAKRIRVLIEYRDQVLAEQIAVRTNIDQQQ
jgi:prepilin-type N-terminal cleavage/methylation domain-containing protein